MKKNRFAWMILLCAFIWSGWLAAAYAAGPTPEEIAKIEAAMPAKPKAKPAARRRVLVFGGAMGFPHDAIPYGAAAFQIMGRKTGAFEAVVTTDTAYFEPAKLARFDAVILNNTTGELFAARGRDKMTTETLKADMAREARLKKSLLDFVSGGKGVVGIHSATDCYYNWTEFGQMMGGYFDGHPWHEPVTLKVDDPASPLTKAYPASLTVTDEIYQIREPYSRQALHILTSLDVTKTDMKKTGINRADGDFAISWIRAWGKGRVFYNSLGHDHDIFWNPVVLQANLDGIQYALGDLKADATPSAAAKK